MGKHIGLNQYQIGVEAQKNRLWPRIEAMLQKLQRKAESFGYQVGTIVEMCDEEFSWSFIIHPVHVAADRLDKWHETDLDVKFTINESVVHGDDHSGVNFCLQFDADGGKTHRTLAPFNYTEWCWVPLEKEPLDDRLDLVVADAERTLEIAMDDHEPCKGMSGMLSEDTDKEIT